MKPANVSPSFPTTSFKMKRKKNGNGDVSTLHQCVTNSSICLGWVWVCCRLGKKTCEYYLSKRWQKLQEVVFSKVCILNWWQLWLAFSGRISDLGPKQGRNTVLKEDSVVSALLLIDLWFELRKLQEPLKVCGEVGVSMETTDWELAESTPQTPNCAP